MSLDSVPTIETARAGPHLCSWFFLTETGGRVFINWKLLDASQCPPHKALLCVQMGQKANLTDDHDAPAWEPKRDHDGNLLGGRGGYSSLVFYERHSSPLMNL